MSKSHATEIDTALLAAVEDHPRDLTRFVSDKLGFSRQAVSARIRVLVSQGDIRRSGKTRPTYSPRDKGTIFRIYDLQEPLEEHLLWARDVAPSLHDMTKNVLDIAAYGFTEMVNNAIDHSDGKQLIIFVFRRSGKLYIVIHDDGIGIFRKITHALKLPHRRLALLELAKGKLTTDPDRHTGEGVFFTSRIFDHFHISSGDLFFGHTIGATRDILLSVMNDSTGTMVFMSIAENSKRTFQEVINEFSSGPDDHTFAKTMIPIKLAQFNDAGLVSRSQAKRVMGGVDKFETVALDFSGIETIGPAFADEIFRVFALNNQGVQIVPTHANAEVQQMIRRAEVARDQSPKKS
ncbi:MAG: DUF4325 domain-containing protein [Rhodanobacteraceae bacterium]